MNRIDRPPLDRRPLDRRTYLALVAAGTIAVAGCAGEPADESMDETATEETERSSAEADAMERASAHAVEDEDEANEQETTVAVGELVEIGDLELLVADVDRVGELTVDPDAEAPEADEGTTFVVVDLAIRYGGDEPIIDVGEQVTIGLADDDGAADRVTAGDDEPVDRSAVDFTASRLAPGELARGDLVYAIDDALEGLALELETETEDEAETEEYVVDLDSEPTTESAVQLAHELTVDPLRFGQGVERDGITVTVRSLEHGNNLGGFMQSDEGHEIVAVGVTIENESGRERPVSAEQVQLKDEFGRSHAELSGAVRALEGFDDEVLADGEEFEGTIAYQIEDGLSALYWVFDFTEWGEPERVFWQLR